MASAGLESVLAVYRGRAIALRLGHPAERAAALPFRFGLAATIIGHVEPAAGESPLDAAGGLGAHALLSVSTFTEPHASLPFLVRQVMQLHFSDLERGYTVSTDISLERPNPANGPRVRFELFDARGRRFLRLASLDLVRRVRTPCPRCKAPAWGVVAEIPGLPCGACGGPTPVASELRLGCTACDYTFTSPRADGLRAAPASRCTRCHPPKG